RGADDVGSDVVSDGAGVRLERLDVADRHVLGPARGDDAETLGVVLYDRTRALRPVGPALFEARPVGIEHARIPGERLDRREPGQGGLRERAEVLAAERGVRRVVPLERAEDGDGVLQSRAKRGGARFRAILAPGGDASPSP